MQPTIPSRDEARRWRRVYGSIESKRRMDEAERAFEARRSELIAQALAHGPEWRELHASWYAACRAYRAALRKPVRPLTAWQRKRMRRRPDGLIVVPADRRDRDPARRVPRTRESRPRPVRRRSTSARGDPDPPPEPRGLGLRVHLRYGLVNEPMARLLGGYASTCRALSDQDGP